MLIVPSHIIEQTMQEVVDKFLVPKFIELDMNATGEWLNNVRVRSGNNVGYIDGRNYTEQLSFGRRPSEKLPPIAPLQKWAQAKLGVSPDQSRGVAFAIAKKIQKEGTTWYKKGGSDLVNALSEPEVLNYINDKIGRYLSAQVQSELFNELKEVFA